MMSWHARERSRSSVKCSLSTASRWIRRRPCSDRIGEKIWSSGIPFKTLVCLHNWRDNKWTQIGLPRIGSNAFSEEPTGNLWKACTEFWAMIKTGICRSTIKLTNKLVNQFKILRLGAKIARSRNTSTITSKRTAKMMEMNLWETLTMWPQRMQTRVMRMSTSV